MPKRLENCTFTEYKTVKRLILINMKMLDLVFITHLYRIVIFAMIVGCVGTIEDKNLQTTKAKGADLNGINFSGIHDAVAISYDKIDIFFFPADGEPENLTYIITHDSALLPIPVPAANLRPDYRGLLKYTVRNLTIDTPYNFIVQVQDNQERSSDSPRSLTEKTLSNITANFDGISNVRNTPGLDGLNSFRVEWPEAERLGTEFVPNERDVVEYVITLVDSEELTPGDLNDPTFGEPIRKVMVVPGNKVSHIVTGLQDGTEYYVQVRAVHKGFKDFGGNPSYKSESNINYITRSTLSNDEDGIFFDASEVSANRLNGPSGLSTISVSWGSVQGAFDHFRIYYNDEDDHSFFVSDIQADCSKQGELHCKKVGFNLTSTLLSDLSPLTRYDINVVVCRDFECLASNPFNSVIAATDPGVAIFGGITSIVQPRSATKLDEVYLQMSPPDLLSGNIDGLLVEVKSRLALPVDDSILNHPLDDEANTSVLSVTPFIFEDVIEITIKGIDSNSSEPYCFSVFPFIYADGVVVPQRANEVVRCLTVELKVPSSDDFPGLTNFEYDAAGSIVNLQWASPEGGLYDQIILFVRMDGGIFNFSEAINGTAGYTKFTYDQSKEDAVLAFVPSGTYSFGVLSFISSLADGANPARGYSEFNNAIFNLVVP